MLAALLALLELARAEPQAVRAAIAPSAAQFWPLFKLDTAVGAVLVAPMQRPRAVVVVPACPGLGAPGLLLRLVPLVLTVASLEQQATVASQQIWAAVAEAATRLPEVTAELAAPRFLAVAVALAPQEKPRVTPTQPVLLVA